VPQPATAPRPTPVAPLSDPNAPVGTPAFLIAEAQRLEAQRSQIQVELAGIRSQLRNLRKYLTPAQAEYVRDFFPDKEKGTRRSKEEIARTREVRTAARENASNASNA
jgi:hypothetical protein